MWAAMGASLDQKLSPLAPDRQRSGAQELTFLRAHPAVGWWSSLIRANAPRSSGVHGRGRAIGEPAVPALEAEIQNTGGATKPEDGQLSHGGVVPGLG